MADYEVTPAPTKARYVEDDLQQLYAVDAQIRDLIQKRFAIVSDIKKQNANNVEAVTSSDDWFEGELRGQPRPERPTMNQERPNW